MSSILEKNKQILVEQSKSVKEGIAILDSSAVKILLIVNEKNEFLGTVVDGDVRRGILKGIALEEPLLKIMNKDPIYCYTTDNKKKFKKIMNEKKIRELPILDKSRRVVDLELYENLKEDNSREYPVVIMAGGLGTRLGELTQEIPKVLLPIGEKSLLEISLENLVRQGFKNIYLSVNYKAEMIKDKIGDGKQLGAEVKYIEEPQRLGTAGSLSLLEGELKQPFLVMNGDILTKVDCDSLLKFHLEHKALATMCVKEYDFQVPYGVVHLEGNKIQKIYEKPIQRFFVNAGIYALNPEILGLIPKNTYFDMTNLFEVILSKNHVAQAFPIMEYWIDIGRHADFTKAQFDYTSLFDKTKQ